MTSNDEARKVVFNSTSKPGTPFVPPLYGYFGSMPAGLPQGAWKRPCAWPISWAIVLAERSSG